jgi:hypothetical protein
MLVVSRVLVGLLLLTLGRRLYWLFVAGVGFVAGLDLVPRVLPQQSETMVLLLALGLALLGALVAVVATKVVIAIAGFAAGAGITARLLDGVSFDDPVRLGICLIAGIVGAVLLLVLFDWALILISSLAGATLIVVNVEPLLGVPLRVGSALIAVLAVIGALIQSRLIGARNSRVHAA